MTKDEFFAKVREVLEFDDPVGMDTDLTQHEEYDSLGILNLMTMFDEIGVETAQDEFEEIRTGADLLRIAGDKIDG